MELQTFTFFLLAFVALTDGGLSWGRRPWGFPRDLMDDSIDMTKPENAKADLARARTRRQEPGASQPIDTESDEAQMAKNWAMDYFWTGYSMVSFNSAERQFNEWGVKYLIGVDVEKKDEPGSGVFPVEFEVYATIENLKPENLGEPQISYTLPENLTNRPTY